MLDFQLLQLLHVSPFSQLHPAIIPGRLDRIDAEPLMLPVLRLLVCLLWPLAAETSLLQTDPEMNSAEEGNNSLRVAAQFPDSFFFLFFCVCVFPFIDIENNGLILVWG